jgi:acyl-coenzyme A thioesterase PaaI-like protein
MLITLASGYVLDVTGSYWETLGIEVIAVSSKETVARLADRPSLRGAESDSFHGGVIAALVDCTSGLACLAAVRADTANDADHSYEHLPQTGYLVIEFVGASPGSVTARSTVIASGRRSALVGTDVHSASGDLVAKASVRCVIPLTEKFR